MVKTITVHLEPEATDRHDGHAEGILVQVWKDLNKDLRNVEWGGTAKGL